MDQNNNVDSNNGQLYQPNANESDPSHSSSSSSNQTGSTLEEVDTEQEQASTQVMDEADRVQDFIHAEDPNAWAKLEAISEAYKNIILTKGLTSFGRIQVDHDITSEYFKYSKNDATVMTSQVRTSVASYAYF